MLVASLPQDISQGVPPDGSLYRYHLRWTVEYRGTYPGDCPANYPLHCLVGKCLFSPPLEQSSRPFISVLRL